MQRFEEVTDYVPQEGEFCDSTRRIIIISPYPAALRSLMMALTVRCYDVMLFHHEKDPMLPMLQGDLLIVDRTKGPVEISTAVAGKMQAQLSLVSSEEESAGDSLVWPCPVEAMLLRIEELASQSTTFHFSKEADQLQFKDLVVDLRRITVHRSGSRVELTKTEFDLLKAMLQAAGGVLSRQELLEQVWGEGYFGGSNSVDVHIKSLRHKLGDDPKKPQYISTVRGVGYRIAD
jgi:two-component system, OmpR family, alkaline phosphatase synthesis response regulator PhoP